MSLFQRRHFRRIAEIAARMKLDDKQKEVLVDELSVVTVVTPVRLTPVSIPIVCTLVRAIILSF